MGWDQIGSDMAYEIPTNCLSFARSVARSLGLYARNALLFSFLNFHFLFFIAGRRGMGRDGGRRGAGPGGSSSYLMRTKEVDHSFLPSIFPLAVRRAEAGGREGKGNIFFPGFCRGHLFFLVWFSQGPGWD